MIGRNVKQSVRLKFAMCIGVSLLGIALGLAASGPALAQHQVMATKAADLGVERTAYANFLIGRFAMTQGDVGTASRALEAASETDPSNRALREKAFLLSLVGGHIPEAETLGKSLPDTADTTDAARMMRRLLEVVTALRSGKSSAALKASDELLKQNPHERAAVLLLSLIHI